MHIVPLRIAARTGVVEARGSSEDALPVCIATNACATVSHCWTPSGCELNDKVTMRECLLSDSWMLCGGWTLKSKSFVIMYLTTPADAATVRQMR
jgi:hypothetical protein